MELTASTFARCAVFGVSSKLPMAFIRAAGLMVCVVVRPDTVSSSSILYASTAAPPLLAGAVQQASMLYDAGVRVSTVGASGTVYRLHPRRVDRAHQSGESDEDGGEPLQRHSVPLSCMGSGVCVRHESLLFSVSERRRLEEPHAAGRRASSRGVVVRVRRRMAAPPGGSWLTENRWGVKFRASRGVVIGLVIEPDIAFGILSLIDLLPLLQSVLLHA